MITHWVGEAWEELCFAAYDKLRNHCWETTGCLITADGSEDHKIKPEDLPDYQVPETLDLPVIRAEPETNMPQDSHNPSHNSTEEEEVMMDQDKELDDNEEGEAAEFEDREEDRYFDWGIRGRKMKVSYENGWFIGSIEYYNVDLGKYHIVFVDGSED